MYKKFDVIQITDLPSLILGMSRYVSTIVWHCSATVESDWFTAEDIERWHKARKFSEIGYNLVVRTDGTIQLGRDWNKIPAHVQGYNSETLGFCYIGGTDKKGKAKDTRTEEQKKTMLAISEVCKDIFLIEKQIEIKFKGHRDYSPDLNKNGIIEPFEYMKECPSFDVKKEITDKL